MYKLNPINDFDPARYDITLVISRRHDTTVWHNIVPPPCIHETIFIDRLVAKMEARIAHLKELKLRKHLDREIKRSLIILDPESLSVEMLPQIHPASLEMIDIIIARPSDFSGRLCDPDIWDLADKISKK